jgi:hypothetical protein
MRSKWFLCMAIASVLLAPVAATLAQEVLVPFEKAEWLFLRGSAGNASQTMVVDPANPPAMITVPTLDWTEQGFDTSSPNVWEDASQDVDAGQGTAVNGDADLVGLPIGYGDNDDDTVLTGMEDAYTTVFLRTAFSVANLGLTSIGFTADVDDGSIIYVNGFEVGRVNAANTAADPNSPDGGIPATAVADGATRGPVIEGGNGPAFFQFPTPDGLQATVGDVIIRAGSIDDLNLQASGNVLAVLALNSDISSSDLTFDVQVVADDPTPFCPSGLSCTVGETTVTLQWTNNDGVIDDNGTPGDPSDDVFVPNDPPTFDGIRVLQNGVEEDYSPLAPNATIIADLDPGTFFNEYQVIAYKGTFECPALTCITGPPSQDLVVVGAQCRVFRGSAQPSAPIQAWRGGSEPFDDSDGAGWEAGVTGVGYADGDEAAGDVGGDPPGGNINNMQNSYAAYFLRLRFQIDNQAVLDEILGGQMVLEIDYDDGFAAFVNGNEIARSPNMAAVNVDVYSPTASFTAGDHEAGTDEQFIVADVSALDLAIGTNVLAIETHNATLGSSDASCIPRLFSRDVNIECPENLACVIDTDNLETVLNWTNGATVLDSITVMRDGVEVAGSPFPGSTTSYTDTDPGDFTHTYEILGEVGAFDCPALTCDVSLPEFNVAAPPKTVRLFRGSNGFPSSETQMVTRPNPAPADCADTIDNDADGNTDALDPDCIAGGNYENGDPDTVMVNMQVLTTAWTGAGFDDAAAPWENAMTAVGLAGQLLGIGYADSDDAPDEPPDGGTLLDMQMIDPDPTAVPPIVGQEGYGYYFIRCDFTITQPQLDEASQIFFENDYDDAYAAYIDGVEIARSDTLRRTNDNGTPGDPTDDFLEPVDPIAADVVTNGEVGSHDAGTPELTDISSLFAIGGGGGGAGGFGAGPHTLSVATFNTNLTSSDASCIPRIFYRTFTPPPTNTQPNAVAMATPGTIMLPTNQVTLDGSGSTDADVGDVLSYAWVRTAGPASAVITNASLAVTTVTFTEAGNYTFRLTVDDNSGQTNATDTALANVTVNPEISKGVGPFQRGDCNNDGADGGNVSDVVTLLNALFLGNPPLSELPCVAACNFNGIDGVPGNTADALFYLSFNFLGGPPVPEPRFGPDMINGNTDDCGMSTRPDDIAVGCREYTHCP